MTKELLQQADELMDLYNNQGLTSTFAIRRGKVQTNYDPAKVIQALADEVRGKEKREDIIEEICTQYYGEIIKNFKAMQRSSEHGRYIHENDIKFYEKLTKELRQQEWVTLPQPPKEQ